MSDSLAAKLEHAQKLALELMGQHGLLAAGWVFAFNRARRAAGMCYYPTPTRPGRVALSVFFVARNSADEILDTIRHEVAHALAGRHAGHGPLWRAWCRRTGARPVRCFGTGVDMPLGPWRATCPACGRLHGRHRRPRPGTYHCLGCPARGRLIFTRVSVS